MAIFIFQMHQIINSSRSGLALIAASLIIIFVSPALGAGYVISAKDRAQAVVLTQQAYSTFQAGDYPQALSLLSQADQLRPDQPDGWNLRGVVLLKQKAYDQAQAAFARAAALDPDLWAAQFNLAEVLFQRKDYAHARLRFERLLSQTDRFKAASKWELVQYKAYVSTVLMGDDQAAGKKLAKLPATGAATPAFLYAQAALSFSRKNPAQAQKSVAAAQAAYPSAINDLFLDSLVQAGWQPPALPLAANVPGSLPNTLSNQTALPPGPDGRPTFVVDPQLQAASAGPLPVADGTTQPVVPAVTPAPRGAKTANLKPKGRPTPAGTVDKPSTPRSDAGTSLDDGGLLIDE